MELVSVISAITNSLNYCLAKAGCDGEFYIVASLK